MSNISYKLQKYNTRVAHHGTNNVYAKKIAYYKNIQQGGTIRYLPYLVSDIRKLGGGGQAFVYTRSASEMERTYATTKSIFYIVIILKNK